MDLERVEASPEVVAFFLVPDEGLTVVAEVVGKGGHIVGSVGEAEYVIADEGARGLFPEWAVIVGGGNAGELFDNEQIQSMALDFLPSNEIKRHCPEVSGK